MSILSRVRATSQSSSSSKAPSAPTGNTTFPNNSARLSVGAIAKIFIKMRHLRRRSKRPYTIFCDSGLEPLTHPRAQQATFHQKKDSITRTAVVHKDTYICAGNGGVDVVRLLRVTRSFLVEQAIMLGANTLVDERWSYVINQPKNRPRGQYKISVHYTAFAVLANCRDTPHPVAMDNIQGIPGLMTVISRSGQ